MRARFSRAVVVSDFEGTRRVAGRSGRARFVCVAVAAVLAVLGAAVVSSAAVAQQADDEVRIVARKLDNGKVEFGLQQHRSDDSWGERQLPARRLFPTTATVGRWLASAALTVSVTATGSSSAADVVVRITARKRANGKIEFGLQQRLADDSWGERLLPRQRLFPTTATAGRWLQSTPITVTPPVVAEDPAGEQPSDETEDQIVLADNDFLTAAAKLAYLEDACRFDPHTRECTRQIEGTTSDRVIQMANTLFECEFDFIINRCSGTTLEEYAQLWSRLACPVGWHFNVADNWCHSVLGEWE